MTCDCECWFSSGMVQVHCSGLDREREGERLINIVTARTREMESERERETEIESERERARERERQTEIAKASRFGLDA